MSDLATATASAQLSNQLGRALLAARGNHLLVDSTPPLGGPNETFNPIDLLLGALATCGAFLFETTARNEGIALDDVSVVVEADFDGRGINQDDINPKMQRYRVSITCSGPTDEQKTRLGEAFTTNCPIFTTLVAGAPIDLTVS